MIKHKRKGLSLKVIILLWVIGIAGQICWNLENQWFNMYVYKFFGYDMGTNIITYMVIFSAIATFISTFIFGTLSDRKGKRKPFICFGYIIWGLFTFLFGITHKLNGVLVPWLMITIVVLADSIMSFFGSMGNDSGFSSWTTDLLTEDSKGAIGIALAAQPVIGTIAGTVVGGILVNAFGYTYFFLIAGALVSIIGLISLFTMKDVPGITPKVEGTFKKQLFSAFNFKDFIKNKELVLVFTILATFFIGFNCFFNYIGNIFVYNYGFNEGNFGYVEGAGLILAIIIMVIITMKVKKDRSPLMTLISILSEVLGLIVLTIVSKAKMYDSTNLLSAKNILLFIGVIIMGFGYVMFMSTIMVWAKSLYPEDKRGQIEGIRILAFVLIPMIFGGIISKIFIGLFGEVKSYVDSTSGMLIEGEKVPNEALFIVAIVIMLITLVPLFFVSKLHKERKMLDENIQNR